MNHFYYTQNIQFMRCKGRVFYQKLIEVNKTDFPKFLKRYNFPWIQFPLESKLFTFIGILSVWTLLTTRFNIMCFNFSVKYAIHVSHHTSHYSTACIESTSVLYTWNNLCLGCSIPYSEHVKDRSMPAGHDSFTNNEMLNAIVLPIYTWANSLQTELADFFTACSIVQGASKVTE